jgi:hypothetical protein
VVQLVGGGGELGQVIINKSGLHGACLQAGSSVNGWSLGDLVRKRMVSGEAAVGPFVASCPLT